jgi:DNA-binding MarR family transcriptional regulator
MIHQAPDVTRLIDRLVKAGLAKRGRSKTDARLSLTYITPKGLKLLETMDPEMQSVEAEMRQKMSAKDAKQLAGLLEKLFADETAV